jgi:two-component system NarL family response regulator
VIEPEVAAILVAIREALFRESLLSTLDSQLGFSVVGGSDSGPAAVADAARLQPDVAVVDEALPPDGGPRCAAEIIAAAPTCRVLLLGYDDSITSLEAAFQAGASGLLSKRGSFASLLDAIEAVHRDDVVVPQPLPGELIRRLVSRRTDGDLARASMGRLTEREREVLSLLVAGADNGAIAQALVISPLTARTHVSNAMRKLRVHSRLEAAMFVIRHGLQAEMRPHPSLLRLK